jgi:hypothetical protein
MASLLSLPAGTSQLRPRRALMTGLQGPPSHQRSVASATCRLSHLCRTRGPVLWQRCSLQAAQVMDPTNWTRPRGPCNRPPLSWRSRRWLSTRSLTHGVRPYRLMRAMMRPIAARIDGDAGSGRGSRGVGWSRRHGLGAPVEGGAGAVVAWLLQAATGALGSGRRAVLRLRAGGVRHHLGQPARGRRAQRAGSVPSWLAADRTRRSATRRAVGSPPSASARCTGGELP